MYFAFKTLLSALIIATVTHLSEKSPIGAAFLKSLPITSLIVFFLMKFEGRSDQEMATMSWSILWLVLPSLLLFIVLPICLARGMGFYLSMAIAVMSMSIAYAVTLKIMAA